jgi:hypothetical protein
MPYWNILLESKPEWQHSFFQINQDKINPSIKVRTSLHYEGFFWFAQNTFCADGLKEVLTPYQREVNMRSRAFGMDTEAIADEEDAGMEELESLPQTITQEWLQRRMSEDIYDEMEKLCLFPYEFCSSQQVVQRDEVI